MIGKSVAIATLLAILVLMLVLQTTTPTTAGPLGIVIVFALIYLSALGLLTFLIYASVRFVQRIRHRHLEKDAAVIRAFTLRRAYYFASVIALAPVILIAIQSVGSIRTLEVGLIIVFEILACIYIAKRQS